MNAFKALACLMIPPMYHKASCDKLPYLSPAKMFLPSLESDWCTCIPVPLSPTTGFGIKVAVLPKACATFCTTYLYFCTSSAFLTSVLNKVPISH